MPEEAENPWTGQDSIETDADESLQSLLEHLNSLNREDKLHSVLEQSISLVQKVMNSQASTLMLVDRDTGELILSMPSGPVKKQIQGKRLPKGTGIAGWVVENEEPYYSNNPKSNEVFGGDISDKFTTRNIICVPLYDSEDKVLGALQAINRQHTGFSNQDVPIFETLAEHVSVAIERTRELEKVKQQLEEKQMKLTEVHHRIKNSLSTIKAIIEMEISSVEDDSIRELLERTCARIDSMTEVHDLLHSSGLEKKINLGSYLKRLAEEVETVLSNPSQNISVNIKAETIKVDMEVAMNCGLIINELLMNCYKHAFQDQREEGEILVKLSGEDEDTVVLQVSDNGKGTTKNFPLEDSDSVGSWLIKTLLRSLDGKLDINRDGGTSFVIRFKQ